MEVSSFFVPSELLFWRTVVKAELAFFDEEVEVPLRKMPLHLRSTRLAWLQKFSTVSTVVRQAVASDRVACVPVKNVRMRADCAMEVSGFLWDSP